MMERSTELVSSAASGSYGANQTENDDTLSEGADNSEETLNLVQGVVLRTLQKHSQASSKRENAADDEEQGSTQAPTKSSNPEDIELLAHLLEQVHDVRRNRRRKPPPPEDLLRTVSSRRRGRSKKPSEELRMTLKAATAAAKAAADAAEAAAVSVARNTEAIEFIMNSMLKKKKKKKKKKQQQKKFKDSDEKEAIVKSNQRTHWILGFMAITTIAWRFGVVKVAKRISSKLNDPLGYVGGLIGNNDGADEKAVEEEKKKAEAAAEKGNFLDKLPHIDMPEFLPNSSSDHDKAEAKDTSLFTKTAAAVDVKTKEVEKTAFSFANLLHIKRKKT